MIKQSILALALAVSAGSVTAQSFEFGVVGSHDYTMNRGAAGVSLGYQYANGLRLTGAVETTSDQDQNRWSLLADVPVLTAGSFSLGPVAGITYLQNDNAQNAYGFVMGVGASLDFTDTVALHASVSRQFVQDRPVNWDSNRFSVSLRYKF